jgi:hypothetical protein
MIPGRWKRLINRLSVSCQRGQFAGPSHKWENSNREIGLGFLLEYHKYQTLRRRSKVIAHMLSINYICFGMNS